MGLRDEIIESPKARADLFKWKIILVAAIRAAVLGAADPLGGTARAGQDILCAHMNLRIRVIG